MLYLYLVLVVCYQRVYHEYSLLSEFIIILSNELHHCGTLPGNACLSLIAYLHMPIAELAMIITPSQFGSKFSDHEFQKDQTKIVKKDPLIASEMLKMTKKSGKYGSFRNRENLQYKKTADSNHDI